MPWPIAWPLWLFYASSTTIQRHVKISASANPYDPAWELYFENRIRYKMENCLKGNRKLLRVWQSQHGICPVCGQLLDLDTGWNTHHIVWRSRGGSDQANNLQMLHPACHWQIHGRRLSVVPPRPTR